MKRTLVFFQLVGIFIFNTVHCEADDIPQKDFCGSKNVVKARLLKPGYIAAEKTKGKTEVTPIDIPQYYRVFELEISKVLRTNKEINQGGNMLYYAYSKDTSINADADGCGFYDIGDEAIFHFDDWDDMMLKHMCKGWKYSTTEYERNALMTGLYDCDCQLEKCWDRLKRKEGVPECDKLSQMLCRKQTVKTSKHKCIWKGARSTCVNPNHLKRVKNSLESGKGRYI